MEKVWLVAWIMNGISAVEAEMPDMHSCMQVMGERNGDYHAKMCDAVDKYGYLPSYKGVALDTSRYGWECVKSKTRPEITFHSKQKYTSIEQAIQDGWSIAFVDRRKVGCGSGKQRAGN